MKKLSNKQKMILLFIACIMLSTASLNTWSQFGPLTLMSFVSSALMHIAVPMFLGWVVIQKKILA